MEQVSIDFDDFKDELLVNPKLPLKEQQYLKSLVLPKLNKPHIWLQSSGTTGSLKLIALSKEALFCSAEAVNNHIQVTGKDIWFNNLPIFHVGGLSVHVRSYLSKTKIISTQLTKWSAKDFVEELDHSNSTICSLVPTQVFDLVHNGLRAPTNLRIVFVGGGRLAESLYLRARELGWPILLTYGMTELCSQIATSEMHSLKNIAYPKLKVLSHIEVQENKSKILSFRSKAACTAILSLNKDTQKNVLKLMNNNVVISEDFGKVRSGFIEIIGRKGNVKKISGELVSLDELNKKLFNILMGLGKEGDKGYFAFKKHARKENELILVLENDLYPVSNKILNELQKVLLPVLIPQKLFFISQISRTVTGKIILNTY